MCARPEQVCAGFGTGVRKNGLSNIIPWREKGLGGDITVLSCRLPELTLSMDESITGRFAHCQGGVLMAGRPSQQNVLDFDTPADAWDRDASKRALDELFSLTRQYKSSAAYHSLLTFVSRFRFYSPFNAMLIHVQMQGARFVAPPGRWLARYGRRIREGARPLVILQPMGPVLFVFDVSDTEPEKNAPPLPKEVENPFEITRGRIGKGLERVVENARRDGVKIGRRPEGSQSAGSIRTVQDPKKESQRFLKESIPVRYLMLLNSNLKTDETEYATIVHELAHLYCGHLGTPNENWWPDRRGLDKLSAEFEAESVSYLVCSRRGIETHSTMYLSGYLAANRTVPPISLDCVMKTAGLIETMTSKALKPREGKRRAAS